MRVIIPSCFLDVFHVKELKDRMSQYIDDMNETPTIFKWKYKMDKMAGGIVVDKDYGVLIC